jgi:hypothetical protein
MIARIARLRVLSRQRRNLLFRAVLFLAWYRLALQFRPFQKVLEAGRPRARSSRGNAVDMVWAVDTASRLVPGVSCLAQALAARRLLLEGGHDPKICLGVSGPERFEAHAWVELDGVPVIGQAEMGRFVRLPYVGGGRPP